MREARDAEERAGRGVLDRPIFGRTNGKTKVEVRGRGARILTSEAGASLVSEIHVDGC